MRHQQGTTLVEYALILGLIFLVMAVAFQTFALRVTGTMNYVKNEVVGATDA